MLYNITFLYIFINIAIYVAKRLFTDDMGIFEWPSVEKKYYFSPTNGTFSIQSNPLWLAIVCSLWWEVNGGSNLVIVPKAIMYIHTYILLNISQRFASKAFTYVYTHIHWHM